MLVAQTSTGVARVDGGRYDVLDVGGVTLSGLITAGAMGRLERARVITTLERDQVRLHAPVEGPGKVIIVGLNYEDHAAEVGMEFPAIPRVHLVAASAVTGPEEDIAIPSIAPSAIDFEGELAVIIGALARDVSVHSAWSYVAGVTAANDVSARDVQNGSNPLVSGPNIGLAKSFDGFKPLGPALLTVDEMRQGRQLRLRTLVDGEVRQDASTADMHFSVAEIVARISQYATLRPGDVILTGTPGGVGGATGRFLQAGQVVEVDLEGVGVLRNRLRTVNDPLNTLGKGHHQP